MYLFRHASDNMKDICIPHQVGEPLLDFFCKASL